jgi:hypothetical protein
LLPLLSLISTMISLWHDRRRSAFQTNHEGAEWL